MSSTDRRARWSIPTFLVGFAGTLLLLAWISLGFLVPLVLPLSAAIVLGGINERLVALAGGRRRLVALGMTLATFLVVLGPLALIIVALVQEVVPLLGGLIDAFESERLADLMRERIPPWVANVVNIAELEAQLRRVLGSVAAELAGFVAGVPAMAADLLIGGFVSFLALYVYFARGPQLARAIVEAMPMERRHTQKLIDTIALAIRTVFVASFITAAIQFALGYVAFQIVGVQYAVGLAAVMAFLSFIFSLVPVLGSGLVWAPVGVVLLFSGRPIAGIFILAWGALVLGSVDNFVKPLYAKGQLQLSPLLVFVTLFGGIAVFGPIGALLGPLVAALAAAFLRIWTTEFLVDAEPLPRIIVEGKRRRARWFPRLRRRRAEPAQDERTAPS